MLLINDKVYIRGRGYIYRVCMCVYTVYIYVIT